MNRVKIILCAILVGCILIQFIRPDRNQRGQALHTDISMVYNVPDNVRALLQNACYDCHSDNTSYPWYSYIQPIGWILARDIENGKAKLNFSAFGSLSSRRQSSKLQGIANRLKDGTMPLLAYRLLHQRAQLNDEERRLFIQWTQQTQDSITMRK